MVGLVSEFLTLSGVFVFVRVEGMDFDFSVQTENEFSLGRGHSMRL